MRYRPIALCAAAITLSVPATALAQAPVSYPNCDAVRAAGAAPLHRGDPGYRAGLDADDDGVACETGDTTNPSTTTSLPDSDETTTTTRPSTPTTGVPAVRVSPHYTG